MTPAEKMGLKIGDKVRVTGATGSCFRVGDEIVLVTDDGSDRPGFKGCGKFQWAYLSGVEPVCDTSTTVTGPATITVAAGETITFEGNAAVKQDWVPKFGDRVVFVDPPEDMVGEFGVVIEVDQSDDTYRVVYNNGKMYDHRCKKLSKIKPYKAA